MGVTGWLKNTKGFMFGDINNKRSKYFFSSKLGLFYFKGSWCSITERRKEHIAVNGPER